MLILGRSKRTSPDDLAFLLFVVGFDDDDVYAFTWHIFFCIRIFVFLRPFLLLQCAMVRLRVDICMYLVALLFAAIVVEVSI